MGVKNGTQFVPFPKARGYQPSRSAPKSAQKAGGKNNETKNFRIAAGAFEYDYDQEDRRRGREQRLRQPQRIAADKPGTGTSPEV